MLLGGERASGKFRRSEGAVVPERRDHAAHLGNSRGIDTRADDADTFAGVGEHLAPGIDDQRVAIAAPPGGVLAPLRRGKDEAAVLDRPARAIAHANGRCPSAP